MEGATFFSKGQWIVHHYYGVGQITGIENKSLDGNEVSYYTVDTRNSRYWIPVESEDSSRLRPLSSPAEIKKIISILERRPKEMDPDHLQRKRVIREVLSNGSLTEMAQLIRDLTARQHAKKLNPTEEDALDRFKDGLIREWAVSMKTDMEEARDIFQKCLQKSLGKAAAA
jgi:CarD family transcriptional regulator